jgi:hypothetical protein
VRKILSFFLVVFSVTIGWAQSDFTLNNMDHIFQSTYVNSAALPDHKVSVGLPGVYGGFVNSGFALKDVISSDGVNWDLNALKSKISSDVNYLYAGTNVDLFHIRIRANRTYFSFSVTNKNNLYFSYPKALERLATLETKAPGPGGDGSSIDLNGLGIDQTSYAEYAVGITTMWKNLVFGGKVKLLQGINNFSLKSDNLGLDVEKNLFDLSFHGNSTLYKSAPIVDSAYHLNPSLISNTYSSFKNIGFATDLAFSYQFRKNIVFSAAVNNIGFITWKANAQQYNLNSSNANFSGADILPSVFAGKNASGINITDSTANNLKPKATNVSSYTTWLVPNAYLTGRYYFTPRLSVSLALMFEYYKLVRAGFGLGAQYKLGRLFSLTGTMVYQYNAVNFGTGVVFKPGPFQIYVVADNLLAIEGAIRTATSKDGSVYAPTNSRSFNLRVGINLVFGREHMNEQQALNKKY